MTISKTPLRVSFAGGGTDVADYYRIGYGAIVGSAIRKYFYVTVKKRFDDDIRISYARTKIVDSVDKIAHGLVREALRKVGIRNGIEITPIAGIPSRGTGVGSSSVVAVGLLNALYTFKGYRASPKKLTQLAKICYVVPNQCMQQIEDIHLLIEHMLSLILRDSPDCTGPKGR
jgi:D-glycero-alpha-D-manno-heptose-7-phosphate kinase